MGELNYIGWLAMLWIGFNLVLCFAVVERCNSDLEVINFWEFLTVFWSVPSFIINNLFKWNIPKWLGSVIWFVPLFLTEIVNDSIVQHDDTSFAISIGQLFFVWVY